MDDFWKYIWKSFPLSAWSAALYLVLSYWASKKLPSTSYKRIAWLAAWADSICILGILVLIGDIFWLSLCWLRWSESYSQNAFSYILLPMARNISMIFVCTLLVSHNWLHEGYISFSRQVKNFISLNILYLVIYFSLAPGREWTHWLYALQNGYACWPYTWFISYPIGRAITSLIWIKMWGSPHVS